MLSSACRVLILNLVENIISLNMVWQRVPLFPVVADIFMSDLEERALDRFTDPPSVWYQFVDDIFSVSFIRYVSYKEAGKRETSVCIWVLPARNVSKFQT